MHPAALYETAALMVVFVVLLRLRTGVAPAGTLFAVYVVLSAIAGLIVEIVRTNRPILLGLTEAQWTSIVLSAGATVWLWRHLPTVSRLSIHGAAQPAVSPPRRRF